MTEFDKLDDVRAEPEQSQPSGARMRDVAEAAGVSVATVSNVINHPDLVAPRTRERVDFVIQELDFQPDPHAKALRGLAATFARPSPRKGQDFVPGSGQKDMDTLGNDGAGACSTPTNGALNEEFLRPGNHLSLRVGPELLNGIVDEVMPDRSCFWLWTDGGMGRRMIDSSVVAAVDKEYE